MKHWTGGIFAQVTKLVFLANWSFSQIQSHLGVVQRVPLPRKKFLLNPDIMCTYLGSCERGIAASLASGSGALQDTPTHIHAHTHTQEHVNVGIPQIELFMCNTHYRITNSPLMQLCVPETIHTPPHPSSSTCQPDINVLSIHKGYGATVISEGINKKN